jgi:hypothetical protein
MNPIDQNRLLQMRSAIVAQNQALQRAAGLDTPPQSEGASSFTQTLSDAVRAVDTHSRPRHPICRQRMSAARRTTSSV